MQLPADRKWAALTKMNTKIIAVVVGIIILLGAGGYFVLGNKTSNNIAPATAPTQTQKPSSSLFDLLTKGGNQKCDFASSDNGTDSKGTAYISGDKMRVDLESTVDGKTSTSYIIRNADTNYIWGSDVKQGIKVTLSEEDLKNDTQVNQYINSKENVDYNCAPWAADNSKFNPPTDIKFTDFTSMMPKTSATPGSGETGVNCSACSYLSGDQKAACLAQLHCPAQ